MRKQLMMAALLSAAALTASFPAQAGGRHNDRVYADSFGNLVVESAAGYKRIIVGQGDKAKELAEFVESGRSKVVYLDREDGYSSERCYRPGALVKGRSYMYGLSDGELPVLSECQ